MITKIEIWKTDDGKEFTTEVEALRHENELLRKELDFLKSAQSSAPLKRIQNAWNPSGITGFYGDAPNSQRPAESGYFSPPLQWSGSMPSLDEPLNPIYMDA